MSLTTRSTTSSPSCLGLVSVKGHHFILPPFNLHTTTHTSEPWFTSPLYTETPGCCRYKLPSIRRLCLFKWTKQSHHNKFRWHGSVLESESFYTTVSAASVKLMLMSIQLFDYLGWLSAQPGPSWHRSETGSSKTNSISWVLPTGGCRTSQRLPSCGTAGRQILLIQRSMDEWTQVMSSRRWGFKGGLWVTDHSRGRSTYDIIHSLWYLVILAAGL